MEKAKMLSFVNQFMTKFMGLNSIKLTLDHSMQSHLIISISLTL